MGKRSLLLLLALLGGAGRLCAQVGPAAQGRTQPSFCTLFAPSGQGSPAPDDAALLRIYTRQARAVRSLHLDGMLQAEASKEYGMGERPREVPVSIDFAGPDMLRITGLLPFMSSRGFDLSSDGREFRLLVPDHGKRIVVFGPVYTPVGTSAAVPVGAEGQRETLRPQPIIDALHWREGALRGASDGAPGGAMRWLDLELAADRTPARRARLGFDLAHGEIASLALFDGTGKPLSEVHYSDWQQSGTGADQPDTACLPRHMEILGGEGKYRMKLRVFSTVLNPAIAPARFRLIPPMGIAVQHLKSSGK